MRWEYPWLLLLLALVPVLMWRARRPGARRAAVLWVRVGEAWGRGPWAGERYVGDFGFK